MGRMKRKKPKAVLEREAWERQAEEVAAEREAELLALEAERQREEREREVRVAERHEVLRVQHEAQKRLTAELTRARVLDLSEGGSLEEFLEESEEPPEPVLGDADDCLHYRGGNSLLVAEYKAGKTTMVANLAASIADQRPFLNRFPINMPHGRVAILNYEMDKRHFREWMRRLDVENPERIVVQNLRGWSLPFWEQETMLRTAEWLVQNRVGFLIVDPLARAWRGLVESEGDNVQLAEFFGALDELKRLSDVSNLLITAHRPRAKEDRARGGAEVEAWPDSNWYLNVNKTGERQFRAFGRDVDVEKLRLDWDEPHLTAGGLVEESGEITDRELDDLLTVLSAKGGRVDGAGTLRGLMKGKNERKSAVIEAAEEAGLISVNKEEVPNVFRLVVK